LKTPLVVWARIEKPVLLSSIIQILVAMSIAVGGRCDRHVSASPPFRLSGCIDRAESGDRIISKN